MERNRGTCKMPFRSTPHIFIYVYIHIYVYTYVQIYMCICVIYLRTYVCTYIHILQIYMCIYVSYIYIHIHICIYTYTYMQVCVYVYATYLHTYIIIYVCVCLCKTVLIPWRNNACLFTSLVVHGDEPQHPLLPWRSCTWVCALLGPNWILPDWVVSCLGCSQNKGAAAAENSPWPDGSGIDWTWKSSGFGGKRTPERQQRTEWID